MIAISLNMSMWYLRYVYNEHSCVWSFQFKVYSPSRKKQKRYDKISVYYGKFNVTDVICTILKYFRFLEEEKTRLIPIKYSAIVPALMSGHRQKIHIFIDPAYEMPKKNNYFFI